MAASKIYLYQNDYKSAAGFARQAFEANSVFLRGGKMTAQNILMDETELAIQGLEVAVQSSNKNLFDFFYSFIINSDEVKKNPVFSAEVELLEYLISDKEIDFGHMVKFESIKSLRNPALLVSLLKKYRHSLYKRNLYEMIAECPGVNAAVLNDIAQEYQRNSQYGDAVSVYMKSISRNKEEASTYFYLIACLVESENFEDIPGLISLAEENFRGNPAITEKIAFLRKKLQNLNN
jgi:hypothetical protein